VRPGMPYATLQMCRDVATQLNLVPGQALVA
jgi:hypothetical protein